MGAPFGPFSILPAAGALWEQVVGENRIRQQKMSEVDFASLCQTLS